MLHVIGDSHVGIFGGHTAPRYPQWPPEWMARVEGARAAHIGPAPAIYLDNPGHWTRERLFGALSECPSHEPTLLVFGEIDCRAYMLKARNLALATAREVARRYASVAREIRQAGRPVMVWAVIPSARDGVHSDPGYPAFGTSRERTALTRIFNEHLAEFCAPAVPVVSIFEELLDANGDTREEFYGPDHMHLGEKALPMIVKALEKVSR